MALLTEQLAASLRASVHVNACKHNTHCVWAHVRRCRTVANLREQKWRGRKKRREGGRQTAINRDEQGRERRERTVERLLAPEER